MWYQIFLCVKSKVVKLLLADFQSKYTLEKFFKGLQQLQSSLEPYRDYAFPRL